MKENLGGYQGKLIVEKSQSGKYYFHNYIYGMEAYIHPEDIAKFISSPHRRQWGDGRSFSNDIHQRDTNLMIDYLKRKLCRYKTVTDVIKSQSKYKKKYLMQFSMGELQEYIKKKEDEKHVKVKSGN